MDLEKLRKDFPLLNKKINKKPIIYFDNACMSLRPVQIINAVKEYYESLSACAGRSSHRLTRTVEEKYNETRKQVAKFINARQKEIIFCRNTTEAINLVAYSFKFKENDIIVGSDKEHNSNLVPWLLLEKRKKIKHIVVESKPNNEFDLEKFKETIEKHENIRLVSIVYVSNLDGLVNPIKKISKIVHKHDIMLMVDAAQAAPHILIDVKNIKPDFLAFSGHKMLGPTGTGILYVNKKALNQLEPFMLGGDTVANTTYKNFNLLDVPERYEAGLQNYAGFIGLGEAIKYLKQVGMKKIEKREEQLNKHLKEIVYDKFKDKIEIIGNIDNNKRSAIFNFNIKGLHHHQVALMLDELSNIMVRSGQHCLHSWFNKHGLEGSVRASLYFYNTEKEIEIFVETLRKIIRII